jgi:hypothetical protein
MKKCNFDLAVDDDGRADVGADERLADGVEVSLEGGGRVADGDPVMPQAGVLRLQALHDGVQGLDLADDDLALVLVDVDKLELAVAVLGARLEHLAELLLVGLDHVTCRPVVGKRTLLLSPCKSRVKLDSRHRLINPRYI